MNSHSKITCTHVHLTYLESCRGDIPAIDQPLVDQRSGQRNSTWVWPYEKAPCVSHTQLLLCRSHTCSAIVIVMKQGKILDTDKREKDYEYYG